MKKNKYFNLTSVLFLIYLLALFWIIIFKMGFSHEHLPHLRNVNLIPFGQSMIINNAINFQEIIYNALVFVPFGIYLSVLNTRWFVLARIVLIMATSIGLETIQYVFSIGASDITDVIMNTLGGIVGIGIYGLILKFLKSRKKTEKIINTMATVGTVGVIAFVSLILVVSN